MKPVGWMNKDVTSWLSCTNQHPETEIDEWIPLYTHPVKELTDEEIAHIALEDPFWWNPENIKCDIDWLGFAKAILRKAQEK